MSPLKAFLVLMTILATGLSLPFSATNTSQVSCFTSNASATEWDLLSALYGFCNFEFPIAQIEKKTCPNSTFNLTSGGTAFIGADLLPGTPDLDLGDCLTILSKVITACELEGQSSGGIYNPARTGDSTFTVRVNSPSSNVTSTHNSSSSRTHSNTLVPRKNYVPNCFPRGSLPDAPAIPALDATQAGQDLCKHLDGKILHVGDDYAWKFVAPSGVADARIYAMKTLTVTYEHCIAALDPIVRQCSDAASGEFHGGHVLDVLAHYFLDARKPGISRRSIEDGTGLADGSSLPALETQVSVAPICFLSSGADIPETQALEAARAFCNAADGNTLKQGGVFRHNTPVSDGVVVAAQVTALQNASLAREDCEQTFALLLSACVEQKGNTNGGYLSDSQAQYLITPLAGDVAAAQENTNTESHSRTAWKGLAHRESTESFNATESTNSKFKVGCNSFPWADDPLSIDYQTASNAADYLCFTYNRRTIEKGHQQPVTFPTNPSLFANVIGLESIVVDINDCNAAYDTLFKACTWENIFYAGIVTFDVVASILEVLPAAFKSLPATTAPNLSPRAAARSDTTISPDDIAALHTVADFEHFIDKLKAVEKAPIKIDETDCDQNGVEVTKIRAYISALSLCFEAGTGDWSAGQGITQLYKDASPWISARIIAQQAISMNVTQCAVTFGSLISSCSSDASYCGGTLDANGARWDMEMVAGSQVSVGDGAAAVATAPAESQGIVVPRQDGQRCLVAEASPVSKQTASEAIGQFCRMVGSTQIEGGSGLASTLEVDGQWIALQITATDDAGFTLYDQTCIGGFEILLAECSDGADDTMTEGGTLVGEGATWSLRLVYI